MVRFAKEKRNGILILGLETYHHKLRHKHLTTAIYARFPPVSSQAMCPNVSFSPLSAIFKLSSAFNELLAFSDDKLKFSSCIINLSFDREEFLLSASLDSLINLKNEATTCLHQTSTNDTDPQKNVFSHPKLLV